MTWRLKMNKADETYYCLEMTDADKELLKVVVQTIEHCIEREGEMLSWSMLDYLRTAAKVLSNMAFNELKQVGEK
jgi:DNA topoisomerase IA